MNSADEHERLVIRDAMKRLLDGDPIRSDGKLTIKALAVEAGLNRSRLTHKHTDLKDEFYERVRAQNATPAAMRELYGRIASIEREHTENREELQKALEEKEMLARALVVLSHESEALVRENADLTERLGAALESKVRPFGRERGLSGA